MCLSVSQFFVVPNKTDCSKKERLEQFAQFLCKNSFNWVQNVCEMSHFQKRWSTVSSSWPRNVSKEVRHFFESTNTYLLGVIDAMACPETSLAECQKYTYSILQIYFSSLILKTFFFTHFWIVITIVHSEIIV